MLTPAQAAEAQRLAREWKPTKRGPELAPACRVALPPKSSSMELHMFARSGDARHVRSVRMRHMALTAMIAGRD
jgi:hypothetical protein